MFTSEDFRKELERSRRMRRWRIALATALIVAIIALAAFTLVYSAGGRAMADDDMVLPVPPSSPVAAAVSEG